MNGWGGVRALKTRNEISSDSENNFHRKEAVFDAPLCMRLANKNLEEV